MMKQIFTLFLSFTLIIFFNTKVYADINDLITYKPSFVIMKFINATRYESLDSDEVFAGLVLEKMLATRRFSIKETQPLNEDIETMLNGSIKNINENVSKSNASGNLDALFDNHSKLPISKAQKGQFVDSKVTSAIGKEHDADFIIQGSLLGIGNGYDVSRAFFEIKSARINVVGDLKIINAKTGEVIWVSKETGEGKQDSTNISWGGDSITIGQAKLNSNLYARAMNDMAEKLVNNMINDIKAHKLNLY